MAKTKFYLVLDGAILDNKENFQKRLEETYMEGITPIRYHKDTLLDMNTNTVDSIIMLECEQRWRGAAKRYFRKRNFSYMNQQYDGLPMFK